MEKSEEYNNEPVYYCKGCLSLKIKTVMEGLNLDYCDECGCTDIDKTHINNWKNLYKNRYGFEYLNKEIKTSDYYQILELSNIIYGNNSLEIINRGIKLT